jgi:hypothetical protein
MGSTRKYAGTLKGLVAHVGLEKRGEKLTSYLVEN